MTIWSQNAVRKEHLDAAYWLLKALEPNWGDAVKKALDALQSGAQISKAGEILAAGLQDGQQKTLQAREEKVTLVAGENERLRRKCAELDQENKRLQADFRQMEITVQTLSKQNSEQEETIEVLKDNIIAQNDVLAEQYYKLANIFGNPNNSTQA
jgi:septal ring factor EnvC (AmiA/AmiB activator)